MITDWRNLEPGMFVRLSCGCEGRVERVDREGTREDGTDTGFYVAYSISSCKRGRSLEESYRQGYGPYRNYFNGRLANDALPIELIEKPTWWDEVVKEK